MSGRVYIEVGDTTNNKNVDMLKVIGFAGIETMDESGVSLKVDWSLDESMNRIDLNEVRDRGITLKNGSGSIYIIKCPK